MAAEPVEAAKTAVKKMPPWVWFVAIAGGLGLSYVLQRSRADVPLGPEKGSEFPASIPFPGTQGAVILPGAPAHTINLQPPKIESNRDWRREGTMLAIAVGMSATKTQAAIDNYLNGEPLDDQEANIIEFLLKRLGPPPEGAAPIKFQPLPATPVPTPTVPPADSTPPPTTAPPAQVRINLGGLLALLARLRAQRSQAPTGRTHVVQRGETLSSISRRYYGHTGHWRNIWNANKHRLRSNNPNLIYPGEVLVLP